jgi:hypothetical protein
VCFADGVFEVNADGGEFVSRLAGANNLKLFVLGQFAEGGRRAFTLPERDGK